MRHNCVFLSLTELFLVVVVTSVFSLVRADFEDETSDLKLVFATGLVRHGTATPGVLLPNDPYTDKWIELGLPEKLTPVGSLQHYKLGVTMRRHYKDFTSDIFDPEEIYLLSTPRSRAQLAAHNTMAGFYGLPRKKQDFERCSGMVVEPTCEMFPLVKTATFMHREEWINCNRLRSINRRTIGPLRTIAFHDNQQVFEQLSKITGFTMTNFNEARIVHEAVETMKAYGLKLPGWANEELLADLKVLYSQDYDIVFAEREQRRLTGGPTLHIILNALHQKAYGTEKESRLKMTMLFGHTSSLMSLTKAIGVQLEKTPGWSANLMFELYQSVSDERNYFVRTIYKNSTYVNQYYTLDVPGCGLVCSLEQFIEVLAPMAVANYKTECMMNHTSSNQHVNDLKNQKISSKDPQISGTDPPHIDNPTEKTVDSEHTQSNAPPSSLPRKGAGKKGSQKTNGNNICDKKSKNKNCSKK